MAAREWLILSFTLPKDPSRVRVSVWRKLKKAGSVNIDQSMWMLPFSQDHRDVFEDISEVVRGNKGKAHLMQGFFIDTDNRGDIQDAFDKERKEEYKDFSDTCEDYQDTVKKKIKKEKLKFSKLEEYERELKKLSEWFDAIKGRDFFDSKYQKDALKELETCRELFDRYCNELKNTCSQ